MALDNPIAGDLGGEARPDVARAQFATTKSSTQMQWGRTSGGAEPATPFMSWPRPASVRPRK
jgi:hypothetical protein